MSLRGWNPFSWRNKSRKTRQHLKTVIKCNDIVSVINDVLIQELEIGENEVEWYYEPTDVVSNCTRTLTHPGLYFAISGGYGFEMYLPDDDYERLYERMAGTIDLDIDIFIDTSNLKFRWLASESFWFYSFLVDRITSQLHSKKLISDFDYSTAAFNEVTEMGTIWFNKDLKLDLIIGPLLSAPSLPVYLNTDGATFRNWKPGFRIFDVLHMFILCFHIGYSSLSSCFSGIFRLRLLKLRKIIIRACTLLF